jgi:small membrane protein
MIALIQVILTIIIVLISIYAYKKFRSSYLDAVFILALLAAGFVFVLFPELTNRIAHFVGIGRGADLVFYLSNLFFLFLILKLYAKVRRLEQLLTEKFREKAIASAQKNEIIKEESPSSSEL